MEPALGQSLSVRGNYEKVSFTSKSGPRLSVPVRRRRDFSGSNALAVTIDEMIERHLVGCCRPKADPEIRIARHE
jgi:hypothetical protein